MEQACAIREIDKPCGWAHIRWHERQHSHRDFCLSVNTTATQQRSALIVATLTSFMGPFMISAVNVALPAIQNDFGVDAILLSWVATGYLLAVAVFLMPAGRMGDIYGRKKIFVTGLILYSASCTLAVLAADIVWLLALRVVQGAGAAMCVTTGMAILVSVFPPEKRGRAIGFYVAAVYIGLSVGPFSGGLLTRHLGWRSIFALMLPLGAGSVWVTLRFLKGEWADARGESLDWQGSLLYAAAVIGLLLGATGMPSAWAVGALLAGMVLLALFVRQENRTVHPVLEVGLFRANRVFAFSSLAALINYAATYAVTFLISLYLQYLQGLDPAAAGTVLMAQPVVMAVFSPLAGRLSDRVEPRIIASTGMALTVVGLAGFALIGPVTPLGWIAANLCLMGFGFALFSSPNMSAIMGAVERRHYGVASGTVASMRLMGQMASMALATLMLAVFIGRSPIAPANHPRFMDCIQTSFAVFAVICLAGVYFSLSRGRLRPMGR